MDVIETAKLEEHMENQTSDPTNTYTRPAETVEEENKNGNGKPKSLSNGLRKGTKKYPDYIQIAMPTDSRNKFPLEWWKTGIAFVYALFNLVLTTVMITVVHERVPPKELSPPLPDKFFDYIDRVKWAFSVSEINGIILVGLWITQWLFLRYKSIVGRRFFFYHWDFIPVSLYYNVCHHSPCARNAFPVRSKAQRRLPGKSTTDSAVDFWWWIVHYWIAYSVWRLPLQWSHSCADTYLLVHQRIFASSLLVVSFNLLATECCRDHLHSCST